MTIVERRLLQRLVAHGAEQATTDAIAVGMGLVAFAFRIRWTDDGDLIHPFPLLLAFGVVVLFVGTRGAVTAFVELRRLRKALAQR